MSDGPANGESSEDTPRRDHGPRWEIAKLEADALGKTIRALDSGGKKIRFELIVKLAIWNGLEDPWDEPRKRVAAQYRHSLREAFCKQNERPGRSAVSVGLFAGAGGCALLPNGELMTVLFTPTIRFDITNAVTVLDRVLRIREAALEWWPEDHHDTADDREDLRPGEDRGHPAERRRHVQRYRERIRHLERAYGLASFALAAIDNENAGRVADPAGRVSEPGYRFTEEIRALAVRVAEAEQLLREATQHSAQARYGLGMALGALPVAVVTLGLALWLNDGGDVAYWIGYPAGALGAIVSVLQRMTNDRLRISGHPRQIPWFGMIRPTVGGIFGMLIVALIESKLITLGIDREGSKLALYGALAFFFGFSERFAQDSLARAANAVASTPTSMQAPTETAGGESNDSLLRRSGGESPRTEP